jgi:hypothetical protein
MPSMFDPNVREDFKQRIEKLQPSAQRRWGRMNVQQMVCHLGDQLRMTLGEIQVKRVPSPLSNPVIRRLVIDVLPWPKGRIKGPPEAFVTSPGEWKCDVDVLLELLERFGNSAARKDWPPHPAFGNLGGQLWSRLTCRHFDHHLKQFGV